MVLNTKLAFEIWAGIVAVIIVIAFVAGVSLLVGNDAVPTLTRTQVYDPKASPIIPLSEIDRFSTDIAGALNGGARP